MAFGPKGTQAWNAWTTKVTDATTIRLRLKPLAEVDQITILIWSEKLKDNVRYYVTGLRRGEWTDIEFRAAEARVGWAMDGPSLDGSDFNNIRILFEGPETTRVLLGILELSN